MRMDKTREEFIQFIRHATQDRKSNEFVELYDFLLQSFIRSDANLDGMVSLDEFDALVDIAAALPRKFGYAPTNESLYPKPEDRKAARAKLFATMDSNGDGHISFEEWLAFSLEHIGKKVEGLPKDILAGGSTKEEFIAFIKKAVDKSTPEYRELFYFLLKCFVDADKDRDGAVQPEEFDDMIEIAAAAPRRHGLAPTTSELFKTDEARRAKRKEYMEKMDTNHDGNISLDEWVKYAYDHIVGKAATLK